jgi:methionyl-tRNA formyltransferase
VDNEASADIEKAKCTKVETQEEALVIRTGQLNAKKYMATDEVINHPGRAML